MSGSNYAAYFKKDQADCYVIELIVEESTYIKNGTSSLELRPVIWCEGDPSIPMTFSTKKAANKYLKDVLLEGESSYDIVGYSIKQIRTVQRKEAPEDEDEK